MINIKNPTKIQTPLPFLSDGAASRSLRVLLLLPSFCVVMLPLSPLGVVLLSFLLGRH